MLAQGDLHENVPHTTMCKSKSSKTNSMAHYRGLDRLQHIQQWKTAAIKLNALGPHIINIESLQKEC